MTTNKDLISPELFQRINKAYRKEFGVSLSVTTPEGEVIQKENSFICGNHPDCLRSRRYAIEEAEKWGEPCISFCSHCNKALWAVPIMYNSHTLGGIVASGVEMEGQEGRSPLTSSEVRIACQRLLQLVIDANLTNSEKLLKQRIDSGRERERAEAIHEVKNNRCNSVHEIFMREEHNILAAVKRGDRSLARKIINRMLVSVYFLGRKRSDVLKSFILELVIMISRTAVEAGCEPARLLGKKFEALTTFSQIEGEQDLSFWLVQTLEGIMDAIESAGTDINHSAQIEKALHYIETHLSEPLSRDQVAEAVGLSSAHFSRIFKEKMGKPFSDIIAEYRITKSLSLLQSSRTLSRIALECGFCDQSYFTKVFKKFKGITPKDYKKQQKK